MTQFLSQLRELCQTQVETGHPAFPAQQGQLLTPQCGPGRPLPSCTLGCSQDPGWDCSPQAGREGEREVWKARVVGSRRDLGDASDPNIDTSFFFQVVFFPSCSILFFS